MAVGLLLCRLPTTYFYAKEIVYPQIRSSDAVPPHYSASQNTVRHTSIAMLPSTGSARRDSPNSQHARPDVVALCSPGPSQKALFWTSTSEEATTNHIRYKLSKLGGKSHNPLPCGRNSWLRSLPRSEIGFTAGCFSGAHWPILVSGSKSTPPLLFPSWQC